MAFRFKWILAFFLSLFFISFSNATSVYKTIGKDGSVTFSQEPSEDSQKVIIPPTENIETSSPVHQDIKDFKKTLKNNAKESKKLKERLGVVNQTLSKLKADKVKYDEAFTTCMSKPRIMFADYSKCPKDQVDKSQCVVMTQMPTTPENCTRQSYGPLNKSIKDLEQEKEEILKTIEKLSY